METLTKLVHRHRASIKSDDKVFLDFADRVFPLVDEKRPKVEVVKDIVQIEFEVKDRRVIPALSLGYTKIGKNAYLKEGAIYYRVGRLLVRASVSNNNLHINGGYQKEPNLYKKSRSFLADRLLPRYKDYIDVVRHLVQFPLITSLEMNNGIFPIHGSGVEFNSVGIIFAGLSTVGKSLLATALTVDHGARLISDNYLLIDDKQMYSFPDYLRVSDDAKSRMRNKSLFGHPVTRRYGRDYYCVQRKYITDVCRPRFLFFLTIGPKLLIKPVSIPIALKTIILANNHVREFPEYQHLGLINFLNQASYSPYAYRQECLEKLLNEVEVFEIALPPSKYPADTFIKGVENVL